MGKRWLIRSYCFHCWVSGHEFLRNKLFLNGSPAMNPIFMKVMTYNFCCNWIKEVLIQYNFWGSCIIVHSTYMIVHSNHWPAPEKPGDVTWPMAATPLKEFLPVDLAHWGKPCAGSFPASLLSHIRGYAPFPIYLALWSSACQSSDLHLFPWPPTDVLDTLFTLFGFDSNCSTTTSPANINLCSRGQIYVRVESSQAGMWCGEFLRR